MMSMAAHLAELSDRHRTLERKLAEEISRPGSSDLEIARLKREKLKLKDEIVRLEADGLRHIARGA
jgi:hypothetical protein